MLEVEAKMQRVNIKEAQEKLEEAQEAWKIADQ